MQPIKVTIDLIDAEAETKGTFLCPYSRFLKCLQKALHTDPGASAAKLMDDAMALVNAGEFGE